MSRFIDADALKSKFIPHSEYYFRFCDRRHRNCAEH